jgi:hypothetical protein
MGLVPSLSNHTHACKHAHCYRKHRHPVRWSHKQYHIPCTMPGPLLLQVSALDQQELLSEFRALQEQALSSYSSKGSASPDHILQGDQKAKSNIDSEMEDFLLQQVGALSRLLVDRQSEPLTSPAVTSSAQLLITQTLLSCCLWMLPTTTCAPSPSS